MNRQITIKNFICFTLGIIMVITGAYFADVQAEAIVRLEQNPASVSLVPPELSRSTQDTAEELSGLRETCEALEEARRYLQKKRHHSLSDRSGSGLFFYMFSVYGKEKTVLHSLQCRRAKPDHKIYTSAGWKEALIFCIRKKDKYIQDTYMEEKRE